MQERIFWRKIQTGILSMFRRHKTAEPLHLSPSKQARSPAETTQHRKEAPKGRRNLPRGRRLHPPPGHSSDSRRGGAEAGQRARKQEKQKERCDRGCVGMNIIFSGSGGFQCSPPRFSFLPCPTSLPPRGPHGCSWGWATNRTFRVGLGRKNAPKIQFASAPDSFCLSWLPKATAAFFIFTRYAKRAGNPKISVF